MTYHASFETMDFLAEDILEHAGWRDAESRRLALVDGRFGRALELGSVPEPFDLGNASSLGMNMYNLLIRMRNYRGPNWCGPFIWGGNKLDPTSGSVAFWIRGNLTPRWKLFYQTTTSFGRVERDLVVMRLDEKGRLSGYIVDARYDRHEIVSVEPVTGDGWHHVVFTWDMADGLTLHLDGELVATNVGWDAWWQSFAPGVFHLPSGGCVYDELYIFDRPLTAGEVDALYRSNVIPSDSGEDIPGNGETAGVLPRLAEASGVSTALDLPALEPCNGTSTMVFTDLWTDTASDGHVPGWWVNDGRYVLAWPHPYAYWTITIGDKDFHAQKVDLTPAADEGVNYVTLEGNLEAVKLQALEDGTGLHTTTLLEVPPDHGFFYGSMIPRTYGKTLRIPFVQEWGTPDHYKGDVNLPLTGDTRIHEIGLFNVDLAPPRNGRHMVLAPDGSPPDDPRYGFALRSLVPRRDRNVLTAVPGDVPGEGQAVRTESFRRFSILTSPWQRREGVASVRLDLRLRTRSASDVLLIRLRDPGVPSTVWSHAEVKLLGFNGNGYALASVTLDMPDIAMDVGDRLWLEVCAAECADIMTGGDEPSSITVETLTVSEALDEYTPRELYVARCEFNTSYEYPLWVGDVHDDFMTPMCWGGIFDKVYPVQAARRFEPTHSTMKHLWGFADGTYYSTIQDTTKIQWRDLDVPDGVPEWAAWMREYMEIKTSVAEWWTDHQNPDGQLGGGYNDDTTLLIWSELDLVLDGNTRIYDTIMKCREGFDRTRMYQDGYQVLYPMDRHHTRDPVRAYHNVVLINLGRAEQMEYAMGLGRHYGHPERTPMHYSEGIPFEAGATAVEWYWGRHQPEAPYIGPDDGTLVRDLRRWCSLNDSTMIWYHTEAYKELGGNLTEGTPGFQQVFLGSLDRKYPHIRLAVSWPRGGGVDVARRVVRADDTSFTARAYSFDTEERALTARFYRLRDGIYTVSIAPDRDDDGIADGEPTVRTLELGRFSDVDFDLPPKTPVVIDVRQDEDHGDRQPMPDLAVDPADIRVNSTFITVTVHNIGDASARDVKVTLLADGRPIGSGTINGIDAPTDMTPRYHVLYFDYKSEGERIEVVVDPDDSVSEIFERNNRTVAEDCRGADYFDWSDIPYVP